MPDIKENSKKTAPRRGKSNSKLLKKEKVVPSIQPIEIAYKPIPAEINFDDLNFELREIPKGKFFSYDLQATIRIDASHTIHELNTGLYFKRNGIEIETIALTDGIVTLLNGTERKTRGLLLFVNPRSRQIRKGEMRVNQSQYGTYRVNRKALLEKIFAFYSIKTIPQKKDEMIKIWFNVIPLQTNQKEMIFGLKHYKTITNIKGAKRKVRNSH